MEQDKLWTLLGELSRQLSSNVSQVELLKRQAEELKTQAVHNSSGFTLRRFNVDISKEQFESELERLNATLVLENHALQHENKQLSMLLKDYEGTLETVMARFRTYAYNTQVHDLNLTRHYETLYQEQQQKHQQQASRAAYGLAGSSQDADQPHFQDPIEMQASLFRLAKLLRKALRASQGEDVSDDDSSDLSPRTSSSDEGSSSDMGFGVPPPPTSTELHAKLGGYLALLSHKENSQHRSNPHQDPVFDDALQRDIELVRLREENEHLRGLLHISSESEANEVQDHRQHQQQQDQDQEQRTADATTGS